MRFKISPFNRKKLLIKLCLMHSSLIKHEAVLLVKNHGENHCSLCKVPLCKTAKKASSDCQSCYEKWHTELELLQDRKPYRPCQDNKEQSPCRTAIVVTRKKRNRRSKGKAAKEQSQTACDQNIKDKQLNSDKRIQKQKYERVFVFVGKREQTYTAIVEAKNKYN